MAGVSADMVIANRPLSDSDNATRTTKDGREYPASRPKQEDRKSEKEEENEETEKTERRKLGPPCDGMQFARLAVLQLEQIREDDAEREQAFQHVKGWIEHNER
jgi:hypothetical protein